jgi:curved DNA-binding protein CbpA
MDEKFVDYYKLLDVDISCSTETIRNTYLQLAKKNHPDQGGNAEKFQLICEAYECLYNKNSRKSYDLKYLKKSYDDLKEDELIKFKNEFKEFEQMNKKSITVDELNEKYDLLMSMGANGANGAIGSIGANGANGANGSMGANGANGANGASGLGVIDLKQWLSDISTERDNQDIELKDDRVKLILENNNLNINDMYEYSLFTTNNTTTNKTDIINLGTIDLLSQGINTNYSLITTNNNDNYDSNSIYTSINDINNINNNAGFTITDPNELNKLKEWKHTKKENCKLTSDKIDEYIKNRKKEEEDIIKNFENNIIKK